MSDDERSSAYFDDSRRLTGPNFFFFATGAVLEARGVATMDPHVHVRWRQLVGQMSTALGWADVQITARPHRTGTTLALSAPIDQLFTATEVNEWAWETATAEALPQLAVSNAFAGAENDIGDFDAALGRLKKKSVAEYNPRLVALADAARTHDLSLLVDDQQVSLGGGAGARSFSINALPDVTDFDWPGVNDIPVALVTGSNGKTTTVRLIAAMVSAGGLPSGYSCTDGVFINGEQRVSGDYSGPAGARAVLREPAVRCAVLETARGGMLRRGLAVQRATIAVVTNISADHFGEYGIDNLDDLADAKLIVARALHGTNNCLVINADDPVLVGRSRHLWPKVAVFAGALNHPLLREKHTSGGVVCGVEDGLLMLAHGDVQHSLGPILDMPLTMNGNAIYNISNMAAAVLAASLMGIAPAAIAGVLKTFGQTRFDNPGRLEQWNVNGVRVLLDYAHNPAGLSGLLTVARKLIGGANGRLSLLLGQAGNRDDDDIRALAKTAAGFFPDRIIIKELDSMLRGRTAGEVPRILYEALVAEGFDRDRISIDTSEMSAAQSLVRSAVAGDVVVLPMHDVVDRDLMRHWLDEHVK